MAFYDPDDYPLAPPKFLIDLETNSDCIKEEVVCPGSGGAHLGNERYDVSFTGLFVGNYIQCSDNWKTHPQCDYYF